MTDADRGEAPGDGEGTDAAGNPAAAHGAPPLPGEGTAEGERLREAQQAFDAGDYRRVRELCEGLANASDPEVAETAARLRKRTQVDPIQIGVLLVCLAVFAVIVYVYVVK